MAGKTPYFRLGYFDYKDRLDTQVATQRQTDRFLVIDRQLFGLYSIFDSGVISGWEIKNNGFTSASGISISISPGIGVIKKISSQTFQTQFLNGIRTNSVFRIFATLVGTTPQDRKIIFQSSSSSSLGKSSIIIGTITTDGNDIIDINYAQKQQISYQQAISNAINTHRHRGVPGQPGKIDLTSQVKGFLSGANIDNIDSSKVFAGKFDKSLAPLLNHNDLIGSGNISHAQLDTFYQTLGTANQQMFGNLPLINHLQQSIFLKTKFSELDQYNINKVVIVPGYSADFIDYNHSTAFIDDMDHQIIGIKTADKNSMFFTNNISLPSPVKNIFIVTNSNTPNGSNISFGVNDSNSLVYQDYKQIQPNKINNVQLSGLNLRIAIRFYNDQTTNDIIPDQQIAQNYIEFDFQNSSLIQARFHFRIRFYQDIGMTNLIFTAFSENNQQLWMIDNAYSIPSDGYRIDAGQQVGVRYVPIQSNFNEGQIYYLKIDVWDGDSFQSQISGVNFTITNSSDIDNSKYPIVKNFACIFQLQNKQRINITI